MTMFGGGAQVLSKTMDSTTLTTDKVELATISRDEADGGRVRPGMIMQGMGGSSSGCV